jgi:hypothetical protein
MVDLEVNSIYFINNDINFFLFIDGRISFVLVEPGCTARITKRGNIVLRIGEHRKVVAADEVDPIQLAIFSHRFMSVAEQVRPINVYSSFHVHRWDVHSNGSLYPRT